MATKLPAMYAWLAKEGAPNMLVEALNNFGVLETPGIKSNPVIMGWAKELGLSTDVYSDDAVAWCSLFMAMVAKRAGKFIPFTGYDLLRAASWAKFGIAQKVAMLGDVLVFKRTGGNHVALYVGEDDTCYHILGGNQSDAVCIIRYPKEYLVAIRRPVYSIGQPKNVRVIPLQPTGQPILNVA